MPGVLHLDVGIDAADPGIFARVVLNAGRGAEHLPDRDGLRDDAERGAVARGDVVEIVGAAQAAGAGHVLDDHRRSAGKMRAQMTRDEPAVEVVGASRLEARHDGDGLAAKLGAILAREHCPPVQTAPAKPPPARTLIGLQRASTLPRHVAQTSISSPKMRRTRRSAQSRILGHFLEHDPEQWNPVF